MAWRLTHRRARALADTFGWEDLQPVLQGYGYNPASDGNDLQRQLATTLAVQLIGHIAHHVGIADIDGAASNVAAVRQALHVLDGTTTMTGLTAGGPACGHLATNGWRLIPRAQPPVSGTKLLRSVWPGHSSLDRCDGISFA